MSKTAPIKPFNGKPTSSLQGTDISPAQAYKMTNYNERLDEIGHYTMEIKDILLTILSDMAADIEAYGYTDSKSYLDGFEAMLEEYITLQTARARFSELTQIGPMVNGAKKKYYDHYEYRYKFLKGIIDQADRLATLRNQKGEE